MTMRAALRTSSNRAAVRMLEDVGIATAVELRAQHGRGRRAERAVARARIGRSHAVSMTRPTRRLPNAGHCAGADAHPPRRRRRRRSAVRGDADSRSARQRSDRVPDDEHAGRRRELAAPAWPARRVGLHAAGRGQDRHDQRLHGRLVRRLHAAAGHRRVGRLRPAAHDHRQRLRGRARRAAVGALHERGHEGRRRVVQGAAAITSATICRLSGNLATQECAGEGGAHAYTEYFASDHAPTEYRDLHVLRARRGIFGGLVAAVGGRSGDASQLRPTRSAPWPRARRRHHRQPLPGPPSRSPTKKRGFWSRVFGGSPGRSSLGQEARQFRIDPVGARPTLDSVRATRSAPRQRAVLGHPGLSPGPGVRWQEAGPRHRAGLRVGTKNLGMFLRKSLGIQRSTQRQGSDGGGAHRLVRFSAAISSAPAPRRPPLQGHAIFGGLVAAVGGRSGDASQPRPARSAPWPRARRRHHRQPLPGPPSRSPRRSVASGRACSAAAGRIVGSGHFAPPNWSSTRDQPSSGLSVWCACRGRRAQPRGRRPLRFAGHRAKREALRVHRALLDLAPGAGRRHRGAGLGRTVYGAANVAPPVTSGVDQMRPPRSALLNSCVSSSGCAPPGCRDASANAANRRTSRRRRACATMWKPFEPEVFTQLVTPVLEQQIAQHQRRLAQHLGLVAGRVEIEHAQVGLVEARRARRPHVQRDGVLVRQPLQRAASLASG